MLLNEYEIEFKFRKIRNIRNLGNFHIRGPHIVMSRTDAQNGLDLPLSLHYNYLLLYILFSLLLTCIKRVRTWGLICAPALIDIISPIHNGSKASNISRTVNPAYKYTVLQDELDTLLRQNTLQATELPSWGNLVT